MIPTIQPGHWLLCGSQLLYQCPSGFRLQGSSSLTCNRSSRRWSSAPPACQGVEKEARWSWLTHNSGQSDAALLAVADIDECEEQSSSCPPNLQCTNLPGSFLCSGAFTSGARCFPWRSCVQLQLMRASHTPPNPEAASVSPASVVSAVILVFGGVAALLLLIFCYRRSVSILLLLWWPITELNAIITLSLLLIDRRPISAKKRLVATWIVGLNCEWETVD